MRVEYKMVTSTSSAPRNRISDRSLDALTKAPTHSVLLKLWGTTQEAETQEKELEVRVGFQLVANTCEGLRNSRHPGQGWCHVECPG